MALVDQSDATSKRLQLIGESGWFAQRERPKRASTVYVWPTSTCSIGCLHCNFASPRSSIRPNSRLVAERMIEVAAVVKEMDPWKVALSGGGEPMDEPEAVYAFLEHVASEHLAEVEIITGGHFGKNMESTHETLDQMVAAFQSSRRRGITLSLRLSIDRFHVERIGYQPFLNIITAIDTGRYEPLKVYGRSVLVSDDDCLPTLAASLGATLRKVDDYVQMMVLPSGREVLLYSKNMIIDGRMTRARMRKNSWRLTPAGTVDTFIGRFLDAEGRHIPARTYNGAQVRMLSGLAMVIEHDGSLKILEGNAPDRIPNVFDMSWNECLNYLFADPLTHFLLDFGPLDLDRLLDTDAPSPRSVLRSTNQLYYIVDQVLSHPRHRLQATEAAIRCYRERGAAV